MSNHQEISGYGSANNRAVFKGSEAHQTDRNTYNGLAAEVTNLWSAPGAGQSRQSAGQSRQNPTEVSRIRKPAHIPFVADYVFSKVTPGADNPINDNLQAGAKSGAKSLNGKRDNESTLTELKSGGLRENASAVPPLGGKSLTNQSSESLPKQGGRNDGLTNRQITNGISRGDRDSIPTGQAIPVTADNIRAGQVGAVTTDDIRAVQTGAVTTDSIRAVQAGAVTMDNIRAGEVVPVVQNNALRNQKVNPVLSGKGERGLTDNILNIPPLNWGYSSPSSSK